MTNFRDASRWRLPKAAKMRGRGFAPDALVLIVEDNDSASGGAP